MTHPGDSRAVSASQRGGDRRAQRDARVAALHGGGRADVREGELVTTGAGDQDRRALAVEPIRCSCGAVLADRIEGKDVTIDGTVYQFRRRSDLLTCPDCGTQHPMRTLAALPEVPDTGERRRADDRPGGARG
jgi:hypothetical protein